MFFYIFNQMFSTYNLEVYDTLGAWKNCKLVIWIFSLSWRKEQG